MQLKLNNVYAAFGANVVLKKLNMEINANDHIAVVGRNGCGKTTLLKLLTGEYEPAYMDNGEDSSVVRSGNPVIGYLNQTAFDDDGITMIEEIEKAYRPILNMEQEMNCLLADMNSEEQIKRYSLLQDMFTNAGGYYYKRELESAIQNFGFTDEDKSKRLDEFSGGQRTKIAFLRLILSKPDVLLLDEPTNHLDITAVEWLEEYLTSYKKAFVLVSHDREFLDRVVHIVYEIEYGTLKKYFGNYSAYAEKKKMDYANRQKAFEEQQKKIEHLQNVADRFRYKATKASTAQAKLKQIERMERMEAPERADTRSFFMDITPRIESAKNVLSAKELQVGYKNVLSTVNLEILKGDKIAVVGGNGIGKSTFLKTLAGKIPPLGGDYQLGSQVETGYFDQQMAQYKSDKTVLDDYWDLFPFLSATEARSDLGAFLFRQDDVFKPVNSLSGGEKVRLELCKIFKRRPNFLMLDEPTNHMDIVGKETLEKLLSDYNGTLLFVSHDRYFIRKIASRILEITKNGANLYNGGYDFYKAHRMPSQLKYEEVSNKAKPVKKQFTTPLKEKRKKEQRLAKLEKELDNIDTEIRTVTEALNDEKVLSDYMELQKLQEELEHLEELQLTYMEEWDSLETDLKKYVD